MLQFKESDQERPHWDFPDSPVVKIPPSYAGAQVLSLVRKLRFHVPQSVAKRIFFFPLRKGLDFPGGTVDKNPPANEGDMSLIPGPGRSHMPHSD